MSTVFHVEPSASTEVLYICVVCGHLLRDEHQVCGETCYAQLVRRWSRAVP